MKAASALRRALDRPELYSNEELKKLKNKLDEVTYERKYDQWYNRTTRGFSNERPPEPPVTDAIIDTVHGMDDGKNKRRSL